MKFIHNITITVFAKKIEDENQIAEHLLQFLPEDLDKEKLGIEIEDIRILEGEDIKILKIYLEKQRHTTICIDALKNILGKETCNEIAEDNTRIDDDGCLYIRLDKQSFLEKEKAVLVDHGDCVHFKIMLACFPKNKERAIEVAKKLFENE